MKSSLIKKSAVVIGSLIILLSYQNCSKVQVADVGQSAGALKSTGMNDQTADQAEVPSPLDRDALLSPLEMYENQKAKKSCEDFLALNDAGRLDLNTQTDMSMTSQSGNIDVKASVRNLTIKNVHGNISIKSALNVSIDDLQGNISLNAGHISKMNEVHGNICVMAKSIGSMSAGSGNVSVYAETIDSITVQHGNIDVYGATIHTATVLNGNICLHDGAKILNASEIQGNFGTCD